jgi:purine-binding chemotaxis protein CheW
MAIEFLPGPRRQAAAELPRLFCTFRLGSQLFGVDLREVKEVNTETTVTRIHHAPPQARGYVNLRGQIYLVLDLRLLLGMEQAGVGSDSRLLVFKPAVGDALAGLVDRLGDIVTVESGLIEPWAPGAAEEGAQPLAAELIGGVARLERELLLILQAGRFQQALEQAMGT